MIKRLSLIMAEAIGKQHSANNEQIEVYAYGLEIVIGSAVKIVLLFFISFLINSLYTTILCTLTFVGIRFFGGGVHLSTYLRCLVGSVMILIILGKAATYPMEMQLFLYVSLMVIIVGIYSIIRWVPAGTEKKVITDKELRLKQKLKTMIFFFFCLAVALICRFYGFYSFAASIKYGLAAAIFLITPLGYLIVKRIDGLLDNLFGT